MTRPSLRFSVSAMCMFIAAGLLALVSFSMQPAGVAGFRQFTPEVQLLFVVLLIADVAAEYFEIALPGAGSLSLSQPLIIAAALYFGPFYAFGTQFLATLPYALRRSSGSLPRRMWNLGMATVVAMTPGVVMLALGSRPLVSGAAASPLVLGLAAVSGPIANLGLGLVGGSLMTETSLAETWKTRIAWMVGPQVALAVVGIAMAQVVVSLKAAGLFLFVVPLIVARQTYERTVQLRAAYADTIASLVAALEAKDIYTKGHSVRVARYAVAIARGLGMAEAQTERLEWAALLHDIGKVGVSRRVLAKDGKLSEAEYQEIKEHPAIGARILADVPYLADLVPAIEAHHEKLDGSGYGRGVRGDEIPLEARIMAVADAYDAMTSTRPYRQAMTHEWASDELARCAGSQFDLTVVEAFMQAIAADPSLLVDEASL